MFIRILLLSKGVKIVYKIQNSHYCNLVTIIYQYISYSAAYNLPYINLTLYTFWNARLCLNVT